MDTYLVRLVTRSITRISLTVIDRYRKKISILQSTGFFQRERFIIIASAIKILCNVMELNTIHPYVDNLPIDDPSFKSSK